MGNPNESQVQAKKRRKYQRVARKPEVQDAAHKPRVGPAVATLGASRAGAFRHAEDTGWGGDGGQSDLAFDAGMLFEGGTAEAQAEVLQRLDGTQRQKAIQRIAWVQGNQHVQRVVAAYGGNGASRATLSAAVQTKLEVGEPDDQYEQEADRVADQVMRMPAPAPPLLAEDSPSGNGKGGNGVSPTVSRLPVSTGAPVSGDAGVSPGGSGAGVLARAADTEEVVEEEGLVETEPAGLIAASTPPPPDGEEGGNGASLQGSFSVVDAGLEERVGRLKGSGSPLPPSERDFFESRFGADFGGVRLHSDGAAAQTAEELGARAYTVGSDIAFNKGEYAPGTERGRRLMAHELTHVVQQGGARNLSPQRQAKINRCATLDCLAQTALMKSSLQSEAAQALPRLQAKANRCTTPDCLAQANLVKASVQRQVAAGPIPVRASSPLQRGINRCATADCLAQTALMKSSLQSEATQALPRLQAKANRCTTPDCLTQMALLKPVIQRKKPERGGFQASVVSSAPRAEVSPFATRQEDDVPEMQSRATFSAPKPWTARNEPARTAPQDEIAGPKSSLTSATVVERPAAPVDIVDVSQAAELTADDAQAGGLKALAGAGQEPADSRAEPRFANQMTDMRGVLQDLQGGSPMGGADFSGMSLPEALDELQERVTSGRAASQVAADQHRAALDSSTDLAVSGGLTLGSEMPRLGAAPVQAEGEKHVESKPAPAKLDIGAIEPVPESPSQEAVVPASPKSLERPVKSEAGSPEREPALEAVSGDETPVIQHSAASVLQRDSILEDIIPDWAKNLLSSLRGDASSKKSELRSDGNSRSSELQSSAQTKGAELHGDGESKGGDIQADGDSRGRDIQADGETKSTDIQADQTAKEIELDADSEAKRSELEAEATSKGSELEAEAISKESELESESQVKGDEAQTDAETKSEELRVAGQAKGEELEAEGEAKVQELNADFDQTEQEANSQEQDISQQAASETATIEADAQVAGAQAETGWDSLQGEAEGMVQDLDAEAALNCELQQERVRDFLDPNKPRSAAAQAEWERIKADAQAKWDAFMRQVDPILEYLRQKWEAFKTWLEETIWKPLQEKIEQFLAWVQEKAEAVSRWVEEKYQWLVERWQQAEAWITEKAQAAREWIGGKAEAAREWIGEKAEAAREWIGEKAEAAREWVSEKAEAAREWIGEKTDAAREWIGGRADAAREWIGGRADAAREWIGGRADAAREWIGGRADAAREWIGGQADAAVSWFSTKGHNAVSGMSNLARSAVSGIRDKGGAIGRWFAGVVGGLISGVESVGHQVVGAVSGALNSGLGWLEGKAVGVVDFVGNAAMSAVNWVEGKGIGAVNLVEGTAISAVDGVEQGAFKAIDFVDSAGTGFIDWLEKQATAAITGLEHVATEVVNSVEIAATAAVNWVEGAAIAAVNWLEEAAVNAVRAINEVLAFLKGVWESVKARLDQLVQDISEGIEQLMQKIDELIQAAIEWLEEKWEWLKNFIINAIVLASVCWREFKEFVANFDLGDWLLTQCDKAVGAAVDKVVPELPCNDGSGRGRLDFEGGLAFPLPIAEVVIPAKVEGGGSLEVERRSGGDVSFTYTKGAAGGVEVSPDASAVAQLYVNEEEYGFAMVAQAGAVVGGETSETYTFNSQNKGELCQAAGYLGLLYGREMLSFSGQATSGPMSGILPGLSWAADLPLRARRDSQSASLTGKAYAEAGVEQPPLFVNPITGHPTTLGLIALADAKGELNLNLTFTESKQGYQVSGGGNLEFSGDLMMDLGLVGDVDFQGSVGLGGQQHYMFDQQGNLVAVGLTIEVTLTCEADLDSVLESMANRFGWSSIPPFEFDGGGTLRIDLVNTDPQQLMELNEKLTSGNPADFFQVPADLMAAVDDSQLTVSAITSVGDDARLGGRLGGGFIWELEAEAAGTFSQEVEKQLLSFENGEVELGCEK
jgi:hypothetical protein